MTTEQIIAQVNPDCGMDVVVTRDMHAPWEWYIATNGDYDLDCTYGSGRTPLDAIVDLLDNMAGA